VPAPVCSPAGAGFPIFTGRLAESNVSVEQIVTEGGYPLQNVTTREQEGNHMSYMGSQDRFSYEVQQSFWKRYHDTDKERGRVIAHLMTEVNTAEDEIRRQNHDIRRRLDYIMRDLEQGLSENEPVSRIGEHLSRPEDLEVAIQKRNELLHSLALILRTDERRELNRWRSSPR
jgi:hypothetical protein